jgi:superoxide dismutase, Fe-Mn family
MQFTLPGLNYDFSALEPHIDAKTMEIHHDKHHQAYITNLNTALENYKDTELTYNSIEDLLSQIGTLPDQIKMAVRNNGGGHWNHTFFWEILCPANESKLEGQIEELILTKWGSIEAFKEEFKKAATTRFGSGWAWLIKNESGDLEICSTPNQDNPLMDIAEKKGTPLLGLDVWEHAYYLNYQNKRPDYVDAFWNVVNWRRVNELLG